MVFVLVSCTADHPVTPSLVPSAESTTPVPSTEPTHEPTPATFELTSLAIAPGTLTANRFATISALVTNKGEAGGSHTVVLEVDGKSTSTEQVTLGGGSSQNVTFSTSFPRPGTYRIGVGDLIGYVTVAEPPRSLPSMDAFMKGIAYNDEAFAEAWPVMPRPAKYGPLYYAPQVDASLKKLAATGANWISVIVNGSQESYASTKITRDQYRTASDEALRHLVDDAHSLGIRVILDPALFNLSHEPGRSWIEIGTTFTTEAQWQEWFASYREFINRYATFAQEAGVDLLFVGSELPNTTHREEDWRRVVKEVRERYQGPIAYDSVFWGSPVPEYQRIKWWDAVDYITVDCWYSLTNKNDPTVAELKEGLSRTGYLDCLDRISSKFNKPIIISEIGYYALDGTNKQPSNYRISTTVDLQEQADCYQAAFEVLWGKPWLKGMFWYQYYVCTPEWLESPQNRPAEEVIAKYYRER
jgi:hypothetical protein